jgi:hypothetical protein
LRVLLDALGARHLQLGFQVIAHRLVYGFVLYTFAQFALHPLLYLTIAFEAFGLAQIVFFPFRTLV